MKSRFSVGPALLKNPLGAGWGLLPTFSVVGIELPTISIGNGYLSTTTRYFRVISDPTCNVTCLVFVMIVYVACENVGNSL